MLKKWIIRLSVVAVFTLFAAHLGPHASYMTVHDPYEF